MAITIQSYLRREDGQFVPLREWVDPINDHDNLEGALDLIVNDIPLITPTMWDYIDELWAYIINTLQDFSSKKSANTYFPDQPIKLELKRTSPGTTLISISSRSGKFDKSTLTQERNLVRQLLDAGEEFFTKMSKLDPTGQGQYGHEIEKIREARRSFQEYSEHEN